MRLPMTKSMLGLVQPKNGSVPHISVKFGALVSIAAPPMLWLPLRPIWR
jgi:hypothetical protein